VLLGSGVREACGVLACVVRVAPSWVALGARRVSTMAWTACEVNVGAAGFWVGSVDGAGILHAASCAANNPKIKAVRNRWLIIVFIFALPSQIVSRSYVFHLIIAGLWPL
jgi:hypothetical protein